MRIKQVTVIVCLCLVTWQPTLTEEQTPAGTTAYNISLNHEVYANNSMVDISEIGSTTPNDHNLTALACVTAWRPCCKANRTGQWYFPNGTTVPIQGTGPERATHFYRNRDDNGTVNLNRVNEEVVSPTGIFCCVVPDATGEDTQLCVDIVYTNETLNEAEGEGGNTTTETTSWTTGNMSSGRRMLGIMIGSSVSSVLVAASLLVIFIVVMVLFWLRHRHKRRFPTKSQYPPTAVRYRSRRGNNEVSDKFNHGREEGTRNSFRGGEEEREREDDEPRYAAVVDCRIDGQHSSNGDGEQYDTVDASCSTEGALSGSHYGPTTSAQNAAAAIDQHSLRDYVDVSPYY